MKIGTYVSALNWFTGLEINSLSGSTVTIKLNWTVASKKLFSFLDFTDFCFSREIQYTNFKFSTFANLDGWTFAFVLFGIGEFDGVLITSFDIFLFVINTFTNWEGSCPFGTFTVETILIAGGRIVCGKSFVTFKTGCLKE